MCVNFKKLRRHIKVLKGSVKMFKEKNLFLLFFLEEEVTMMKLIPQIEYNIIPSKMFLFYHVSFTIEKFEEKTAMHPYLEIHDVDVFYYKTDQRMLISRQ